MQKAVLGIIGAGRIGRLHTENIQQHLSKATLKSVHDPFIDKAWVKSRNIPVVAKTIDDIITDPEINAILICSPVSTHIPIIKKAAEAGKHIFCEKPLATEVSEIKEGIEVVKKNNVKLQVGFNRRFDPNFAKIEAAVREGQIGTPHLIRITARDPEPPPIDYVKSSGGLFMDMSIHDLDMARFLAGSEVEQIYVTGSVLVDEKIGECGDIDTAVIQLRFVNGALGVIDNSRESVYGYDQRVEVFGSKGSIEAANNTQTRTSISTVEGVFTDKPLWFFLERYQESYIAELKSFVNAILENKEIAVNGHDGLMSTCLALAAHKSLKENRLVNLSEGVI